MKQNTDIDDYTFLAPSRITAERNMVAHESQFS